MFGYDFPGAGREEGRPRRRDRFGGHRHGRPGPEHHAEHMHAAGGDEMFGGRDWPSHGRFPHERTFGRGFGFGGPRGPGRPGRPGRPFGQGDLRWLVLDLIATQPRHGYEIIKAIEEALNGHYTPSPGVIYPTLTLLEETGLISGESHGAKKLYSLTEEGRAEVESHSADIQAVRERLANARARFGAVPPPELFRAMDNLRAALQVRLAKGELSPEVVQAMTAAIDRAAAEIERS
jgi:DNA-binding PadR family transcriptional regulator